MTNVQATPVSSGAPAGITASGKGTRVSIYLPLEVPKSGLETPIPQLPMAGE